MKKINVKDRKINKATTKTIQTGGHQTSKAIEVKWRREGGVGVAEAPVST